MIKIENVEVFGWEAAIRGMRNPLNSWSKSDSDYRPILCAKCDTCPTFADETWGDCDDCDVHKLTEEHKGFMIGPNDFDLMTRLRNAGTDHSKFMRMINVTMDITAPLYWWKEWDTYKVGTVANSCSTMHKIHEKQFKREDFSVEHLENCIGGDWMVCIDNVIRSINVARLKYLKTKDKKYWWQIIQLLPSSYNQRRTVQLNYQVLRHMYFSRKNHKLDEWRDFCEWIRTLPYEFIITGSEEETENTNFLKKEFHVPKEVSDSFRDEIKQNMTNPISFSDRILEEMQNFTKDKDKTNE